MHSLVFFFGVLKRVERAAGSFCFAFLEGSRSRKLLFPVTEEPVRGGLRSHCDLQNGINRPPSQRLEIRKAKKQGHHMYCNSLVRSLIWFRRFGRRHRRDPVKCIPYRLSTRLLHLRRYLRPDALPEAFRYLPARRLSKGNESF